MGRIYPGGGGAQIVYGAPCWGRRSDLPPSTHRSPGVTASFARASAVDRRSMRTLVRSST
jgi:hypothetical protein